MALAIHRDSGIWVHPACPRPVTRLVPVTVPLVARRVASTGSRRALHQCRRYSVRTKEPGSRCNSREMRVQPFDALERFDIHRTVSFRSARTHTRRKGHDEVTKETGKEERKRGGKRQQGKARTMSSIDGLDSVMAERDKLLAELRDIYTEVSPTNTARHDVYLQACSAGHKSYPPIDSVRPDSLLVRDRLEKLKVLDE
eukprot:2112874-Rhodomonas_salina.1